MNVLLLVGGNSSEREVSFYSGKTIFEALQRLGHKVTVLDPASDIDILDSSGQYIIPESSNSESISYTLKPEIIATTIMSHAMENVDVVFVGLHGGSGENGAVQCLLDMKGMKYTGSGMTASAVAMDKAITKRLAASVEIRTPLWALCRIEDGTDEKEILEQIRSHFDFPMIVKPNDSGSTVGLTNVETPRQLYPALVKASVESPNVLVEKYIKGRELTVSVLDGQALPVVEIIPESGLYDYEAKYMKGKSQYIVPAEIRREIKNAIQEDAVKMYDIVGASGLVRVDFILDENEKHYFLELNTLPGMTALSLVPMAAKAVGIQFDELITKILDSALK